MNDNLYFFVYRLLRGHECLSGSCTYNMPTQKCEQFRDSKADHLVKLETTTQKAFLCFAWGLSPCLEGTYSESKVIMSFLKIHHLSIKKISYLSLFPVKQIASGVVAPVLLHTAKLTSLYVPQYSFPFHY